MSSRGLGLIAAAVILSAGLLGVQLASGGSSFVPQRAADPCRDRGGTVSNDLESLGEAVVLTGVDEAACNLGVSRERLLLALPSKQDRADLAHKAGTDESGLSQTIKDGLRTGVGRLDRAGRLPSQKALLALVADQLGLSKGLVDLIPSGLADTLPSTADLLRSSLDRLDVNTVLDNLGDRASLESTLRDALLQGAIDEAKSRLGQVLPGPLQGLLGSTRASSARHTRLARASPAGFVIDSSSTRRLRPPTVSACPHRLCTGSRSPSASSRA